MSDELYAGLERQLVALAGRKNAGWKVGLTSGQARDSMGAGFRPFGYIPVSYTHLTLPTILLV